MNIDIEVKSSTTDAMYVVSIGQDDQGVMVSCTCPAGAFGKLCKHKLEILNASLSPEVAGNSRDFNDVRSIIKGSEIQTSLIELSRADQNFQEAKRFLDSVKKKLEKLLTGRSLKK